MHKLYPFCLLLAGTAIATVFPAEASSYFSFSIGGPGYHFSYGYSGGYARPHHYYGYKRYRRHPSYYGYKRYYRHPYYHGYKRYHQHPHYRHGKHRRYPGFWKPHSLRKHHYPRGHWRQFERHFSFGVHPGHKWFRHGSKDHNRGPFSYPRY